jgi:hypothetical protein
LLHESHPFSFWFDVFHHGFFGRLWIEWRFGSTDRRFMKCCVWARSNLAHGYGSTTHGLLGPTTIVQLKMSKLGQEWWAMKFLILPELELTVLGTQNIKRSCGWLVSPKLLETAKNS